MEIVVLDGYTLNPGDLTWDGLAQLGHLTVYDRTVPEETVARAAGAEVVFTNKVLLTREVLSQLPDCVTSGCWPRATMWSTSGQPRMPA